MGYSALHVCKTAAADGDTGNAPPRGSNGRKGYSVSIDLHLVFEKRPYVYILACLEYRTAIRICLNTGGYLSADIPSRPGKSQYTDGHGRGHGQAVYGSSRMRAYLN